MSFSDALRQMLLGWRLTRTGWKNPDLFVALEWPGAKSKMSGPYLYQSGAGTTVPWLPSQTDLFAEDWDKVGGTRQWTTPSSARI